MSTPALNPHTVTDDELEWIEVVRQKVGKLRFGSLQITVHDGRVTQVESVERTRFVPKIKTGQES